MSNTNTPAKPDSPFLIAGIPAKNLALYHQIRFLAGDPAALIHIPGNGNNLLIRDIEAARAKAHARADHVHIPDDFAPPSGLSGDRETATAQATAEFIRRAGISSIRVDRSLPMSTVHELNLAGITLKYDPDLGVLDRRVKDAQEIAHLREAQLVTEAAIEMACTTIARATAGKDGILQHEGADLTSERVHAMLDAFLLARGYANDISIVASGPTGADCHNRGEGPIRTGESVIIDVFPRNKTTLYNGDCTRCVVHADIPEEIARMHAVVLEAKAAATAATRAGSSGDAVHAATTKVITAHGYEMGLPIESDPPSRCAMVHGTGHGIGIDVHEPPLLDVGGPELLAGDALTIEPGLYQPNLGGIRIEDMVIVTESGCDNLNTLHTGLDWK